MSRFRLMALVGLQPCGDGGVDGKTLPEVPLGSLNQRPTQRDATASESLRTMSAWSNVELGLGTK